MKSKPLSATLETETLRRYGAAAAVVAVALGIRWLLTPILGLQVPYLQFFPAIMVAAWYGGFGPGVLATGLSAMAAAVLFLPPFGSPAVASPADLLSLILFVGIGSLISALNGALHRSRDRVEAGVGELRASLAERERLYAALEAERERLVVLSDRVQCQNEELATQTEELQVQNEELEEQHRQRSEFLAMLAHELRNPLAPIVAAVEVLRQRGADEPVLRRQRDIIDRQSRHLARLVDDLLDVSRVTQGKIALQPEVLELGVVVEQSLQISQPLIDERKHELSVQLPPTPIRLDGDRTRLVQVLCNLLNNAARYTPPGGRIWLSAAQRGGEVTLRVRDNGPGIPPELLPRIFDLFVQGDDSPARSTGGLGVGLTLVRSLAGQHGGSVEARSDGPGTGSEFIVRLPALPDGRLPDETIRTHHSRPLRDGDPLRVLIVDDNRDAADTLGDLLSLGGHDVRIAYGAHDGLAKTADCPPDVILMDIGMPEMDGYEAAQHVRKMEDGHPILLIAITGYGLESDRQRAREAGFDHHLTKPVDPDVLLGLLRTAT